MLWTSAGLRVCRGDGIYGGSGARQKVTSTTSLKGLAPRAVKRSDQQKKMIFPRYVNSCRNLL